MLTIRFARIGKKNKPKYRVVLQEHTAAPTGRHVAVLGSYDPHTKKSVLSGDSIKEWIGKGAQISDSVYNLLVREGILEGEKRKIRIKESGKKEKGAEEGGEKKEDGGEETKKEETIEEKKEEPKEEKKDVKKEKAK